MILHPAIIALLLSSLLITLMTLYASFYGAIILKAWDLQSGSERQVFLERRTYLVSTLLTYVFAFQIGSFFLYIYTADHLHHLFVGAMCAAGSLNVNAYGYPVLLLKLVNVLLAGLWLILNHVDNRAYDYPLIKKKYLFLMIMAPLILGESVLLTAYFLNLKADVITSCCGTLFSTNQPSVSSEIAGLPVRPMEAAFFSAVGGTLASGIYFYWKGKGGMLLSALSLTAFLVMGASLISFISLYYYELPTHHCPFCILQKEYGYKGYVLYLTLLCGAVSGGGVGILTPFKKIESLRKFLVPLQKRLALTTMGSYSLFTGMVLYQMIVSNLILTGY